jgi:Ca-activated chloride channel family protein
MTDPIDDLRKALKSAPGTPDPARRAEALSAAMAAFDRGLAGAAQESAGEPRPRRDRPAGAGFLSGVFAMLTSLSLRPALMATASVAAVAVGLGIVLTQAPREVLAPPKPVVSDAAPQVPEAALKDEASGASAGLSAPAEEGRSGAAPALEQATSEGADQPLNATIADAAPPVTETAPLARERTETDALAASPPVDAEAKMAAPAGTAADATVGMMAEQMMEAEVQLVLPEPSTEAFPDADPNPVRITAEEPVSTFSIDVDTASYAIVRSSLMNGYLPPSDAVRIEEMVNYFPYAWPAPGEGEAPFRPSVSVTETPWNADTRLVRIGIQGRMPALADRPPLNLVFLIDTSGSMEDANKLPLLVQSFRLLLGELRPEDQVAIVTYAGSAGLVLEPTPASDSAAILGALGNLAAGGSTAGQEGLVQAYAVARGMQAEGEVTRVILATDGDFNVGIADPEALEDYIAAERASGTYLSVLGFGRGNLDDATMQALAQNGNGTAAYIDTLSEAQKVLVDQLTGALFPIADDVKIQVEFNPAEVAEYRLIGYETRALRREDFNNDRVDAGEIGAGTSVTALYEVTPVGSPAVLSDPLRYEAATAAEGAQEAGPEGELGFLKLRYKEPGEAESRLIEVPILPEVTEADADTRFAAAVAGFGQLLTGATYLGDWGWEEAIALANSGKGGDPFGYRAEAVQLMRLAGSLSGR